MAAWIPQPSPLFPDVTGENPRLSQVSASLACSELCGPEKQTSPLSRTLGGAGGRSHGHVAAELKDQAMN